MSLCCVLPFQAQLAHERSRDFDGPLEKVTRKTEAKRKELEDQQLRMQELIDSEKVQYCAVGMT